MNYFLHLYTGDGKGKTTAALGQAVRILGLRKKILLIQFLKKGIYSEINFLEDLKKSADFSTLIEYKQFGREEFITGQPLKEDRESAVKGWEFAVNKIKNCQYDLIILDELNMALFFELIPVDTVIDFFSDLKDRRDDILSLSSESTDKEKEPGKRTIGNLSDIIITGRNAPVKLIEIADLVTEMKKIKHYYDKNVDARKGIEY